MYAIANCSHELSLLTLLKNSAFHNAPQDLSLSS